jgi:hypothetical protein
MELNNALSLMTARSSLQQGLQESAGRVATAAAGINNAFSAGANQLNRLQPVRNSVETGADGSAGNEPSVNAQSFDAGGELPTQLSTETFLSSADADLTSSVIDLLQAKTSFTASAKALSVVNDLERETIDILK